MFSRFDECGCIHRGAASRLQYVKLKTIELSDSKSQSVTITGTSVVVTVSVLEIDSRTGDGIGNGIDNETYFLITQA